MPSIEDKIADIEEEISSTPYNKATQHHIGKLKAKLAQLRERALAAGGGGGGSGFSVKKTGDATVVLLGFPSVGKSTLINKLTNADSEIGSYEFTTLDVVPGMMEFKGARIQLLDLPGIITGAAVGKGRGREILSVVRNSDLVLVVVEAGKEEKAKVIKGELEGVGIRLDKRPPKIKVERESRGGVVVSSSRKLTKISKKTVQAILNSFGFHNARVLFRENAGEDALIDVLAKNRVYIPSLTAVNKTDLKESKVRPRADVVHISAEKGEGLDELRERIFGKLGFMRVFMKPQGKEVDLDEPLIVKSGSSVEEVCRSLHAAFKDNFRYARVSGASVKHEDQRVGLKHKLADGDVLTIIKKN